MSYDIGPRISIAGEAEFRESVKKINSEMKALNAEMKSVTSAYDENDKSTNKLKDQSMVLTKQIENQKGKMSLLTQQYEKQKAKLDVLEKALKDANAQFGEGSKEAAKAQMAYNKQANTLNMISANIHTVTTNLNEMNAEMRNINSARLQQFADDAKNAGEHLESAGRKMTVLSAAITAGAAYSAKALIDYESAFAGVEKTVDGTVEELGKISDGIRAMSKDIPATANDIASVAEQAGQLGIEKENVLSFTKVMIDLGESTNLSANRAADSLARLANITGLDPADYERLGSTIVELGNNAATTESEIVEMSSRLAAAGDLVGFTEPQIMAIATTISSLGIEAEAGGSAISKLVKQFEVMVATGSEGLGDFAKVANLTAEQFSAIWKHDPSKALAAFIDGLGQIKRSGGSVVATLDDLGITEIRLSNAVAAMATSNGLLTKNLDLANQAWMDNTALATEAEKRYATTASQIQIAKNTLNDIAITMGSEFLPMVNNAIEGVDNLGKWFSNLKEAEKENIIKILAITAAIGPMMTLTGKAAIGVGALTTAVSAYRTATAAGTAATVAFTTALNITPIGLAATAIAALASVIAGSFIANMLTGKEAAEEFKNSVTAIGEEYSETMKTIQGDSENRMYDLTTAESAIAKFQELNAITEKTAGQQAELATRAEEINTLLGEQVLILDSESGSYLVLADNMEAYIEKLRQEEEMKRLIAEQQAEQKKIQDTKAMIEEADKLIAANSKEIASLREVGDSTYALEQKNVELRNSKIALSKEVESSQGKYNALQRQIDKTGEAISAVAAQAQNNKVAFEELSNATNAVNTSVDLATNALKEQAEAGEISHATAAKLIDAGYGMALAIDEETGAITINEQAYKDLIEQKIQNQIADLEAQKTSLVDKLNKESGAAVDAAGSFTALAFSKAMANEADTASLASVEAQINSLKKLQKNLGAVSSKSTAASKSTTKAAKSSKQAVDKNVESYKNARKELEYLRDTGVMEEKKFYNELQGIQKKYLKESSDEWKSVNVELYKWKQKQAEELEKEAEKAAKNLEDAYKSMSEAISKKYENGFIDLKTYITNTKKERDKYLQGNKEAWVDSTQEMFEEVLSIYNDIVAEQQKMADNLADYGELFSRDDDGKVQLENIEKQIDALDKYEKALDDLKGKGISDGLLNEIAEMGVEDGADVAQKLLGKSDASFQKYIEDWEEKQQKAQEIADKFYKDQKDDLKTNYLDELISDLNGLDTEAYDAGKSIAENVTKGIVDGGGYQNQGQGEEKAPKGKSDGGSGDGMKAVLAKWEADQALIQEQMQTYTDMLIEKISILEDESIEIGYQSMLGMAKGIEQGESEVVKAITRTVRAAIEAAKDELDIHSPSREFEEIGDYSVDGYIRPWKGRAADVEQSIRDTLRAGVDIARQQITNTSSATTINEGDFVLQIANVNNGRDRDVSDFLRVGEFMRKQRSSARGGK